MAQFWDFCIWEYRFAGSSTTACLLWVWFCQSIGNGWWIMGNYRIWCCLSLVQLCLFLCYFVSNLMGKIPALNAEDIVSRTIRKPMQKRIESCRILFQSQHFCHFIYCAHNPSAANLGIIRPETKTFRAARLFHFYADWNTWLPLLYCYWWFDDG